MKIQKKFFFFGGVGGGGGGGVRVDVNGEVKLLLKFKKNWGGGGFGWGGGFGTGGGRM